MYLQLPCQYTTVLRAGFINCHSTSLSVENSPKVNTSVTLQQNTISLNPKKVYLYFDSFKSGSDTFQTLNETYNWGVSCIAVGTYKFRPLKKETIKIRTEDKTNRKYKVYATDSEFVFKFSNNLLTHEATSKKNLTTSILSPHEIEVSSDDIHITSDYNIKINKRALTDAEIDCVEKINSKNWETKRLINEELLLWKQYIEYETKKCTEQNKSLQCILTRIDSNEGLLYFTDAKDARTLENQYDKMECTITTEPIEQSKDDSNNEVKPKINIKTVIQDIEKILKEKMQLKAKVKTKLPRFDGSIPVSITLQDKGTLVMLGRLRKNMEILSKQDRYDNSCFAGLKIADWLLDINTAKHMDDPNIFNEADLVDSKNLNKEQKMAVCQILNTVDVSFILGPPGTGKTTVIAKAIEMLTKCGQRVLLSSQSNDAIDNALSRLKPSLELRPVRLKSRMSKETLDEFDVRRIAWNISQAFDDILEKERKIRERFIKNHIENHNKNRLLFDIYNSIDVNADMNKEIRRVKSELEKFDLNQFDKYIQRSPNIVFAKSTLARGMVKQKFRKDKPEHTLNLNQYIEDIQLFEKVEKSIEIIDNILNDMSKFEIIEEDDVKSFSDGLENQNFRSGMRTLCNVFGITCNSDNERLIRTLDSDSIKAEFDIAIVDEVSKATLPELLGCILKAKRVVLVGDHRQLPPVFKADDDDSIDSNMLYLFKDLVTNTIFKKLYDKAPSQIKTMLKQQYRMHNEISDIVISKFYQKANGESLLKNGFTPQLADKHKAHNITIALNDKNLITPEHHIYWIDSTPNPLDKNKIYEQRLGTSSYNEYEINMISKLVEQIDSVADKHTSVGVISFYSAQNKKLRKELSNKRYKNINLETNTVDRFQGQERNIIIVSLVRSQPKNRINKNNAFFKSYERLNVAFSRAQTLLIIVGSVDFCSVQNIHISSMSDDNEEQDTENIVSVPVYNNIIKELAKMNCLIDGYELVGKRS